MIQRLGRNFPRMIHPHQRSGVLPGGLVMDGLLDPLAGKRAGRNIGGGHGAQAAVDFLDQAVRQAEAAGGDGVPGAHGRPV